MNQVGNWRRNDGTNAIVIELDHDSPTAHETSTPLSESVLLAQQIARGNRDENDLTNRIFWARHPELQQRSLLAQERGLTREWLFIRDAIVRPALGAGRRAGESRWTLPEAVRRAGQARLIPYDAPGPWEDGRNCSKVFTPGAAELGSYITRTFPGVRSIGGYACRQNTANAEEMSVHGTGRAIDIMIPPVGGAAHVQVGDPIANWLVENAADIGVQYVIWNRTAWGGHRPAPKDRRYGGPNAHIDHIHAEITRLAGQRATPWFAARRELGANSLDREATAGESCTLLTCPRFSPQASLSRSGPCSRCLRRLKRAG